jgi:hypothetical protein
MVLALLAGAFGLGLLVLLFSGRGDTVPVRVGGESRAAVRLTVETNLPTRVTVVHPPEERASEPSVDLGRTVRDADGVHEGDKLVLTNPDLGLRYEARVPSGVTEFRLVKAFRMGHVRFRGVPPDETDLFVFHNDLQVAPYSAGVKIELVEGPHTLQIRGPRLPHPVDIEVDVPPGETVTVDPPRGLLPRAREP